MGNVLYIMAAIFIMGWIIGVFLLSVSSFIHILLVMAFIVILLRFVRSQ